MTTRREIMDDVKELEERTKVLEEKVENNTERIFTHVHAMPGGGFTDTATTTTTATSYYTTFYTT